MEINEEEDFRLTQQRRVLEMNESADAKCHPKTSCFRLTHQCVVFITIGLILALSGSVSIIIIHFNAQDILMEAELINNEEIGQVSSKTSTSENITSFQSLPELHVPFLEDNSSTIANVSDIFYYQVHSRIITIRILQ